MKFCHTKAGYVLEAETSDDLVYRWFVWLSPAVIRLLNYVLVLKTFKNTLLHKGSLLSVMMSSITLQIQIIFSSLSPKGMKHVDR